MQEQNTSPPIIWFNYTTLANWNRPAVGIIRVERSLLEGLTNIYGNERLKKCVWSNGQFIEWIEEEAAHGNSGPQKGDFLISIGLDWDGSYTSSFYELSQNKGIRLITCCYDLIPVLFPQYTVGDVAPKFKEYFLQLAWASSGVLCISERTEKDFLKLCEEIGIPSPKTQIIPLGDNVSSSEDEDVAKDILALTQTPYILFVSTIERRKNHEILYKAYHLLCRSGYSDILPRLIFVGMPGWGVGDLLKDIELDPLTQGLIVQLHQVSDADLNHLYKNAFFCAYPSLYEGWGLPVGEALAYEKAVLSSDQGSLPEVGGSLVRYVNPWNATEWADAILDWVQHPEKVVSAETQIKQEYKIREWSKTAHVVSEFIESIMSDQDGNKSDENKIILYPGYDCSTQSGVHVGPSLRSTGQPGFLMFGPHRPLQAGKYKVSIFDNVPTRGNGIINLDFVHNGGHTALYSCNHSVCMDAPSPLVSFDIELIEDIEDYEVRCHTNGVSLSLEKVLIEMKGL